MNRECELKWTHSRTTNHGMYPHTYLMWSFGYTGVKRDLCESKETYKRNQFKRKETHKRNLTWSFLIPWPTWCRKRPMRIKRDLQKRPIQMNRNLGWSFLIPSPSWSKLFKPHGYTSVKRDVCESKETYKRDLCESKETYVNRKRPM